MGKYQAYPEYKDSGIDSLGSVPSHWEVMQLKRSVNCCVNGIWGSEPNNDGFDTIVIRVADFNRQKLAVNDYGFTFRKIEDKEKIGRLLKKGDLLLEKSGGGEKTLVGQVVLFDKDFEAVTSNFVAKMTPADGFDGRYLNYVFCRFYSHNLNYGSIKQNTGIQNLDSASYLTEKFGFPNLDEQLSIANFLDHETAKIDTLIEQQQQLIQLLKEKRQAVISHAVTKGLNPDAPMKDSGVEWLGEVPAHWVVANLRWFINIASGDGLSNTYFENEADQENIYRVIGGNGTMGYTKYINTVQKAFAVGRVGALCGNVHLIDEPCWITDNALKISSWSKFNSQYLYFLLTAAKLNEYASRSAQPLITGEQVKSLKIVIPPAHDQIQIGEYIKLELERFADLVEKAELAIQLMQERRTALISAAVTGKIDVRNWQAPQQ